MEQAEIKTTIDLSGYERASELLLTGNQLTSLPESIGSLYSLNLLYLSHNQLTSLPESIGNLSNLTWLKLGKNKLTSLPESIGSLSNLTNLYLEDNQLTSLPESVGNLYNLTELNLKGNQLTSLPESIGNLYNLTELNLKGNHLTSLPESISKLSNLTELNLSNHQLTSLPESIGNLSSLGCLDLSHNQLTNLPESISNLSSLMRLDLTGNPLVDLSSVRKIGNYSVDVYFFGVKLPPRYLTKFSDWKPQWLLNEDNAEIRRTLIEYIGYEKICDDLNTITLDIWREYTLLKIDEVEAIYGYKDDDYNDDDSPFYLGREPMVLLKMICPSTANIHILRVPPDMESAEEAITWVNQGIHPDEFSVQT
jgi:leucine-rich repeat protein SHOC2